MSQGTPLSTPCEKRRRPALTKVRFLLLHFLKSQSRENPLPLTMTASIDRFLLQLRDSGRISGTEYTRAYSDGPPLHDGLIALFNPVSHRQLQVTHRVLNIPELLELILRQLTPAEQLRAMGVCRGFHQVIERSPRMAVMESQRTRCKESILPPPYNIKGVRLTTNKTRGIHGISAVLDLGTQSTYYKTVLRKSSMLRKTLIARPALHRARIHADCGCVISRSWLFDNNGGITFGDMFNAVDALGGPTCKACHSKYYVRVRSSRG